jgi:hypothetical protein
VGVKHHKGNSLDPRKFGFLQLMIQSSHFFKWDKTKLAYVGTKIFLYTVDQNIIVTSPNLNTLKEQSNKTFQDINNWFEVNQLALNYNKTQYLQFNTKNSTNYDLKLKFRGNYFKNLSVNY